MDRDHVDQMIESWSISAPDVDTAPLEVAGRLLRCAQLLERSIDDALRPLGLSFGDFDVINTLRRRADPDGTHPKALASSALITSGAMTSRLDRLERSGLVRRGADPADRRAIRVRLTPSGEDIAARALDAVLAADREFIDPLGRAEQRSVADRLRQLLVHAERE